MTRATHRGVRALSVAGAIAGSMLLAADGPWAGSRILPPGTGSGRGNVVTVPPGADALAAAGRFS